MKHIIKKSCMLVAATLVLASCKKFEEINVNPVAANDEQAQVEYFINGSIMGAQMNPDVAERSFVLYWKAAGRQMSEGGTFSVGNYNDQWTSVYYDRCQMAECDQHGHSIGREANGSRSCKTTYAKPDSGGADLESIPDERNV